MAESPSETTEYAIFVEGVGWIAGIASPPYVVMVSDVPDVFGEFNEATNKASVVANSYRRLGLPDVAELVVVRSRLVTVARTPWDSAATVVV